MEIFRPVRLVTTTQIQLFPPPYMIKRFIDCDVVILLEEAQYTKKKFFDHFVIRDGKGLTKNLKLPLTGGGGRDLLCDIKITNYAEWRARTMKILGEAYAGAPNFNRTMNWVNDTLPRAEEYEQGPSLQGLCELTMEATMKLMGVQKLHKRSRSLMPQRPENPSEWIAGLTNRVEGTTYMQGREAMDAYFHPQPFYARGIALFCQDWNPPTFVPNWPTGEISILHALFHAGANWVKGLLHSHRAIREWPVQEKVPCGQ